MNWITALPPELTPFTDRLVATARPCLRLQVEDQAPAQPWQSALGKVTYWPLDQPWPVDENKRPLFGLMQLNLAELPPLEGLPQHGMLQFFLTDNAFWGANPLQPQQQENFRVIYHHDAKPESTALLSDFSFLPVFNDLPLSADVHRAISATADSMPMPPEDYRFEQLLGDIFTELGDEKWSTLNAYRKAIGTVGHRLGGYAGFAQEDPRQENSPWELLLQLDTDPSIGLIWGDYGVAHWFYAPPQTASRSLDAPLTDPFEKIWYGWESS
jgi:uncharacterized protein YwqG